MPVWPTRLRSRRRGRSRESESLRLYRCCVVSHAAARRPCVRWPSSGWVRRTTGLPWRRSLRSRARWTPGTWRGAQRRMRWGTSTRNRRRLSCSSSPKRATPAQADGADRAGTHRERQGRILGARGCPGHRRRVVLRAGRRRARAYLCGRGNASRRGGPGDDDGARKESFPECGFDAAARRDTHHRGAARWSGHARGIEQGP